METLESRMNLKNHMMTPEDVEGGFDGWLYTCIDGNHSLGSHNKGWFTVIPAKPIEILTEYYGRL